MRTAPKIYSYTRFSSKKQRHGDSVRRQIDAIEEWAKNEGGKLTLDTSLRDEGVPGYMGRNAKVGALARFLKAIEEGMVAPGSVLVVENLDRLSRNEPLEGLDLLKTIIRAGVEIVTLHDGRRYTRENMSRDVVFLINALLILARGYEESDTKSKRLSASWQNKRRMVTQGQIISSWVHPWLRVVGAKKNGARTDFSEAKIVVVEERARVVRQIFAWAKDGWGYMRIASELRSRRVKPWGRASWSITRIAKIIKNRAVIGEYQPCRYEGGAYGKRTPDGSPVKAYFPRIVSDEDFENAQPSVTGNPGGRRGKWVRLLSGLLVDPRDRAMHVHSNAGGTFPAYQTAAHLVAPGEKGMRWSAEHLDRCVIAACREINWNRLYSGGHKQQDQLEALLKEIAKEEAMVRRKIENAAEAILSGGTFGDLIKKQVQQFEEKLTALKAERLKAQSQLDEYRRASVAEPTMFAQAIPSDSTLRAKLRLELQALVEKVQVWPDGRTPDSFWKPALERAKELSPPRARHSITNGAVMGAVRLYFKNGQAFTAYVTFVKEGKNRCADVVAVAKPLGMSEAEWLQIREHAHLGESGAAEEPTPRTPIRHRRASMK
jgi:DNA invertase Pin-like site-specific DNA recombinase